MTEETPGPAPGWTAEEATERLLEQAHGFPEHHKQREEWRKEAEYNKKQGLDIPPKYCDWCEANGKVIRDNGGEKRELPLPALDADAGDGVGR